MKSLPDGWEQRASRSSGKIYYRNEVLQITKWERPEHQAPPTSKPSAQLGSSAARNTGRLTKEEAEAEFAQFMEEMGSLSLGKKEDGTCKEAGDGERRKIDLQKNKTCASTSLSPPTKFQPAKQKDKKAMLRSAESNQQAW
jgi:hypothetical protein